MGDAGSLCPSPVPGLRNTHGVDAEDLPSDDPREVHVLVTGFGPFKSFSTNPSWLIAKSLPEMLDYEGKRPSVEQTGGEEPSKKANVIRPPNTSPYTIRIHTHPSPVRVAYTSTASLIPNLLSNSAVPGSPSRQVTYDYVLHIGLASGRDSYTLETLAYRDHYRIKDVDDTDGYMAGEYRWRREGIPARIDVGWDKDEVLRRWTADVARQEEAIASDAQKAVVKLSRDAGRYLCEFILFCSLSTRWKQAEEAQKEAQPTSTSGPSTATPRDQTDTSACERRGKVAFLHVPNGAEAEDIGRGQRVAEAAIRAIVSSWEDGYRNPDVYTVLAKDVPQQPSISASQRSTVSRSGYEEQGTGDA